VNSVKATTRPFQSLVHGHNNTYSFIHLPPMSSTTLPSVPPQDAWSLTSHKLLPRWISFSHQVPFQFPISIQPFFSSLGFLFIYLHNPNSLFNFNFKIGYLINLLFFKFLIFIYLYWYFMQSTIPISISRVNQVDAARLDIEMSAMLKEQLVKVFTLMKVLSFCLFWCEFSWY